MDFNADHAAYPPASIRNVRALNAAIRQVHAQIRLITAADFAAFLELSRDEQRSALLALLSSSEATVDIIEDLTPPK